MQPVTLSTEELRKLLSCGCTDAVALYLYRRSAQPLETALDALHFTVPQMVAATESLRQLGLWDTPERPPLQPERPTYTEDDVRSAIRDSRTQFSKLVGEAQRRLGRTLSTEELKTLLSFVDYLRLPVEVVGLLLSYCVERARQRSMRAPSMRAIEKEAYRWADLGIDTLEEAAVYMQNQLQLQSRAGRIRQVLQIADRRLTPGEEKLIHTWLSWGFGEDEIRMAYEKTCMNTGALKWPYLNSILKSWHEQGFTTLRQIEAGDRMPAQGRPQAHPQRQSAIHHTDRLTDFERRAVEKMLNKHFDEEE